MNASEEQFTGMTGRLREAKKEWEKRHPDISQGTIAQAISAALGEPVSQKKVSRWLRGQEPTYRELRALADLFEVDAGWLAWGEGEDESPMQNPGADRPR